MFFQLKCILQVWINTDSLHVAVLWTVRLLYEIIFGHIDTYIQHCGYYQQASKSVSMREMQ